MNKNLLIIGGIALGISLGAIYTDMLGGGLGGKIFALGGATIFILSGLVMKEDK